jgi:hypothetical protein
MQASPSASRRAARLQEGGYSSPGHAVLADPDDEDPVSALAQTTKTPDDPVTIERFRW